MRDANHQSRQSRAQPPAAQATDAILRELPIEAIEPYENNPRRAEHARYAELKRSIRADGITNPFTVTRRGPEQPYVTYGGGNTRLRIARELFAEGDARFARLLVQVRSWPGEAQVMAAQLSENELRSDISFWEKACAVRQLKAQLEKDLGALSQRKLADRLQALGLPYNVQMVGVFAFATGPMRVLGPWMRVRMANQKLRPAWNRLGQLARRLGLHRLQLQEGMDDRLARVNRRHADALARAASSNGKLPPQERVPTEIDADALIADWHAAVAAMLGVTPDGLQEMLRAMILDSELGAGLLMDVGQTASAPDDEGVQPSGSTMWSVLTDAPGVDAGKAKPALDEYGMPLTPDVGTRGAADVLLHDINSALRILDGRIWIADTLVLGNNFPRGFMVDFPARTLEYYDDKDKGPVQLRDDVAIVRRNVWLLLAEISGQMDRRFVERFKSMDTRWTDLYRQGREAFIEEFETRTSAPISADGSIIVGYIDDQVQMLLSPDLCAAIYKLIQLLYELQRHAPERMLPAPRQPLFEQPE